MSRQCNVHSLIRKPVLLEGKKETRRDSHGAEAAARNEDQLNKLCIARPFDIKPTSGIVFDGHWKRALTSIVGPRA